MKKKTEEDIEFEKVMDALTIQKVIVEASYPPFSDIEGNGYYGDYLWSVYRGYIHPRMKNKFDIIYINPEGKKHRLFGPAYISEINDTEMWYKEGKLHRLDGPAVRHGMNCWWIKEGKLHRLDGPAIITGGTPKQYYIEGQKYSPKEYKKEITRRKLKGLLE